MIIVQNPSRNLMIEDALKAFPDECCGFMFGTEDEEENRIITDISGHAIEIAIAPPFFRAWPYVVKQPARMQMIAKEIAKLENPLQRRFSSCL